MNVRFQTWLILLLGRQLVAAPAEISPEEVRLGYSTGHVLVKIKPEAAEDLGARRGAVTLGELSQVLGLPAGAELEEPEVSQLLRQSGGRRERAAVSVAAGVDLDRFLYLHLPPGCTPQMALEQLLLNPAVEYAELDAIGHGYRVIPKEPGFRYQWHHYHQLDTHFHWEVLRTPDAWEITQGSTNVLVAVLDSGIDAQGEEFTGRLVLPGRNFVSGGTNTTDVTGHGTAVTGILAANANNGLCGVGIDWQCRVLPVKVINDANFIRESWVAQGVDYAVSQGAKVINFSGGADQDDGLTLGAAITNALSRGVIFVAGAGQYSSPGSLPFPARCPPVITVATVGEGDVLDPDTNSGEQLDFVAPGLRITTVKLNGSFGDFGGSSAAAPMVSGICSLLASVRPDLTQEQALILLGAGAEDQVDPAWFVVPDDPPGWDPHYGWGRVNAYYSLLLATTRIDQGTRQADGRFELSWVSPLNARTNRPYVIERAEPLSGAWQTVTNGTFRYEDWRTWWAEPEPSPAAADRLYRVRIVLEQNRLPRGS